jgi:DNA uptake protein ComE-like DNA-binding protein
MILAREQRLGAVVLCGIALVVWIVAAVWPEKPQDNPQKPAKKPWSERRDSIRMADSMRFEQWKADREARYDSFFRADSIRHEAWKIERQHRWDSMRLADSLWRDSVGIPHIRQVKKDTILDLNRCDTAELQLIRGIGRYTAIRIVQYRRRLGGYYSPSQLTDEFFDKLRLDTLLAHFTADPADIQLIPVNKASVDRLSHHPYLRYEQAKAIYTLHRKKIRITSIDDLRSLPELKEEDIRRLEPYLSFE